MTDRDAFGTNDVRLDEITKAYDRWSEAVRSKRDHGTIQRFWESYLKLRDLGGVCGHEDPFGGPCLMPAGHYAPTSPHNDGRPNPLL